MSLGKRLDREGVRFGTLLALATLFSVLAFWIGIAVAAWRYPSTFDWRYMTVSNLLYPAQNPAGFRWAWAGIAVCSAAGWAWGETLLRLESRPRSTSLHAMLLCLRVGFACMLCCAVIPARVLPLKKGHEALALTAFVTLCVAIVGLSYRSAQRWSRGRMLSPAGASRACAIGIASLPLAPLVLTALTQSYLAVMYPQLPWVTLAWRARGVPMVLSFALWEWVTCAMFSVFIVALGLFGAEQ